MSEKSAKRGAKLLAEAEVVGPQLDADKLAERSQALQSIAQTEANYGAERDLVNQLLGQAQIARASADFLRQVGVSKLAYVRESRSYKALAGMKKSDGGVCVGTFDEFCELLGISPSKAHEDIQNLQAFGEQALEAMSRAGIGYRDLRQFRRLSADDQTALAEVAKTGDKEAVLDLAEELIARQAAEKQKLEKQLENKAQEYETASQRAAKLGEQLDKAKAKAALIPRMRPDEKANEILSELQAEFLIAHAHLQQTAQGVETLLAHTGEHDLDYSKDVAALATSLVNQAAALLVTLRLAGIGSPADQMLDVLNGGR